VRFDADGAIEPALALSWEQVDPMRLRLHLRENVHFHNGEPFTAESVRFTIDRYLDPDIGFPAVGFIESLSHAEVIDEHTVDIVTRYPDGLLLNRLAGFILIVPPQYIKEHGPDVLHDKPVGTGAFQFEAWERDREVRLKANRDYWMPDHPKLEGLVFRFAALEEQVKMLLAGEVDVVTELPGTRTLAVETAGGTRVVKQRSFWAMAATLNTSHGPLADVRVRQALNLALNQQDLIRYDTMGNGYPLASLTVEGQTGHNPDLRPYPYDPQRAKALLKEAGVELPLVLRAHARAQSERTARIVAAQLAEVGVHLQIQQIVSDADAIQHMSQPWDIGFGGGPDPMCHAFFTQCLLLYSKSPYALLRDPKFDQMLMEMVHTLDADERLARAYSLDRYVHEQALCLFTYQRIKTYGLRRDVNFVPYVSGMPYFFTTSVDDYEAVTHVRTRD
jgi:peptide/nickel transport system substrate-binding protein